MTRDESAEAFAILSRLLVNILGTIPFTEGRQGSDLRRVVGDLQANGEGSIVAGTVGPALLACFDDARLAGADFAHMSRVRELLLQETPVLLPAVLLTQAAVVMALVQESKIIAAMTFVSREDVEALIARMNDEFAQAEEQAADALDQDTYQALVGLHASVTQHLVATARPLPRIVTYNFPRRAPTLVIAQRLYADAGRADEILAENHIVHPGFAPQTGRVLSA